MLLNMMSLRILGFARPTYFHCIHHPTAVSACAATLLTADGRRGLSFLRLPLGSSRTLASVGRRFSSTAKPLQDDKTTRTKDVFGTGEFRDKKAEKYRSESSLDDSESATQNDRKLDATSRTGDPCRAKYEADWTQHEMYMVTCQEVWDDRPEGARVMVSYIDTAALIPTAQRQRMPTVLLLPSGVANDAGLRNLSEALVDSGFRLVIPNLMGDGTTRGMTTDEEDSFSNQLGERSTFLFDFMHHIDIERYDVAIGYGLGCFPLTALAANFNLFRSVAFVSPIPGHKPFKLGEPVRLTGRMLSMSFNWFWWPISWLWLVLSWRHQVKKWLSVDKVSLSHMQLILSILLGINWRNMPSLAMTMEARKVPLLYVYSEQDPLVDCKSTAEYAEIFGVTNHFTDIYDEHGKLAVCGDQGDVTSERYVKGLRTVCPTRSLMETDASSVLVKELLNLYEHRLRNMT